jgi:DNA polymerase-4/DNA polymerase V
MTSALPPRPLTMRSWPTVILHLDADAFFAACEQAMHPALRGRPVITGKERGIVAAASYEAKALGIQRGVRLSDVERICPDAVILPSDYESYSLFSLRIFEILHRFSPEVEESSIDEGFVDLTGVRRKLHSSYDQIAHKIQSTIWNELGISVSIGVSLTKVLAKIASKHQKPAGVTLIPGREIQNYLLPLPVEEVWGIGHNTAAYLQKLKIKTAYQFALKDEAFIKEHCSKPFQEIWHELNGRMVKPLITEPQTDYQSISKTRTFTPPSDDRNYVFGQLSKNLENACIKARRYQLAAQRLVVFLRSQDYVDNAVQLQLTRASAYPVEMMPVLQEGFAQLYQPRTLYRATAVVLCQLAPSFSTQLSLFDDPIRVERLTRLHTAIDHLSKRFGKHTVMLGSSLPAKVQAQHEGARGDIAWRKTQLYKGENARQRLGLLMLDIEI